jgi:hypothetical protein
VFLGGGGERCPLMGCLCVSLYLSLMAEQLNVPYMKRETQNEMFQKVL